jgi:hypothetical protein
MLGSYYTIVWRRLCSPGIARDWLAYSSGRADTGLAECASLKTEHGVSCLDQRCLLPRRAALDPPGWNIGRTATPLYQEFRMNS